MTPQRRLGQFTVSAIGYGAMPLSLRNGPIVDESAAIRTIHAALDAGITLVDTADIYAPTWDTMGHNEALVAKALQQWGGDRDNVVVATKGGIARYEGEGWGRNGSAEYLRGAVEKALRLLGVEAIDLFYWHRPDRTRPYADGVAALKQLKDEGKIREVGVSNANVEEIQVAVEVLGEGGLAAVQNEFSPRFNHTSWQELRWCGDRGIAFVPFSPLGAGHYAKGLGDRFPEIRAVAQNHGVSPQQVTLAWELALGDHVIPIPGATRAESIIDSAKAMDLQLTEAELDVLNARLLTE
ncbi:aldo/keto reductase [Propionibacteriaceae bacterium G1746]|uniref:aldo/keto reductase n=1 Tax=Aestuariimicrobium sp. G57 TaxID=3418485 RepID=UPI003C2249A5